MFHVSMKQQVLLTDLVFIMVFIPFYREGVIILRVLVILYLGA